MCTLFHLYVTHVWIHTSIMRARIQVIYGYSSLDVLLNKCCLLCTWMCDGYSSLDGQRFNEWCVLYFRQYSGLVLSEWWVIMVMMEMAYAVSYVCEWVMEMAYAVSKWCCTVVSLIIWDNILIKILDWFKSHDIDGIWISPLYLLKEYWITPFSVAICL